MKSANIPDVLRGEKKPRTVTASDHSHPPISPYSGEQMVAAHCGDTPVFIDQSKRIVVPARRV